jgi:hypothetical protein
MRSIRGLGSDAASTRLQREAPDPRGAASTRRSKGVCQSEGVAAPGSVPVEEIRRTRGGSDPGQRWRVHPSVQVPLDAAGSALRTFSARYGSFAPKHRCTGTLEGGARDRSGTAPTARRSRWRVRARSSRPRTCRRLSLRLRLTISSTQPSPSALPGSSHARAFLYFCAILWRAHGRTTGTNGLAATSGARRRRLSSANPGRKSGF